MATGIVKFFNRVKSFGFITPADENNQPIEGATEVFVHGTQVIGEPINEGDLVEYDTGEGRKGIEAKDVKKIGSAAPAPTEEEAPAEEEMDMAA